VAAWKTRVTRFSWQMCAFENDEVSELRAEDRRLAPGQKSVATLSTGSRSWRKLSESKASAECNRGC
jgi:hypothetical protein